jgi:hypothetical protein
MKIHARGFLVQKKPSEFSITKMDYKNTVSEEADDEPTFNTSPDKHKNKTTKNFSKTSALV